MAECKYGEWLTAYHDGELTSKRRRELERHLEECSSCAAELEQLRALSGLLGQAEVPALSEDALARFHRAVPAARERGIVRLCRNVALAAAALLVICGGLLWYDAANQADASTAPAAWEVAAVTLDADAAEAETGETFALWALTDLSRENGQ